MYEEQLDTLPECTLRLGSGGAAPARILSSRIHYLVSGKAVGIVKGIEGTENIRGSGVALIK